MYVGGECPTYTNHIEYTLDTGGSLRSTVDAMCQSLDSRCPMHGVDCLGHVEYNEGVLFMPSTMTASSQDRDHVLTIAKRRCLKGTIDADEYRAEVMRHMRSKTGYIRQMNSITIEGSMKMVISAHECVDESSVWIPDYIANAIKVPTRVGNTVIESPVLDGDYGILVRQPVLWHGGIRPCIIRVYDRSTSTNHEWRVDSSMRLPISMCSTFAADFDGDEMSLFPVKTHMAIEECKAAVWNTRLHSPYSDDGYNAMVPRGSPIIANRCNTMAIATTMCWSDRTLGHKVGKHHARWMTPVSSFIKLQQRAPSPRGFAIAAMRSMGSSCAKSSLQSDIGATSRRSKLGAERVYLNANRCIMCQSGEVGTVVSVGVKHKPPLTDGYFGNPCIRAVSKVCAASMQIALKVKSGSSISDVSPTLSLLSGSDQWLCILINGSVSIISRNHSIPYESIDVVCSLFDISRAPEMDTMRLIRSFIRIVSVESRSKFDPAEYECLVALILFVVKSNPTINTGIEVSTNIVYGEFSTIPRWNMCYVDKMFIRSTTLAKRGSTLVEHMMLGSFSNTPSICGDGT
jgi:RNA polymerase Rpb1, domain 2